MSTPPVSAAVEEQQTPNVTVLIPPVLAMIIEGKFIKIKTRTFGKYTFHTGMIVVEENVLKQIQQWVTDKFGEVDYKPYFSSEKEFGGDIQVSHIVQFDIKGKSLKDSEWEFINHLENVKANVTCKVLVASSTFQHKKTGDAKKKVTMQLVYDTIKEYSSDTSNVQSTVKRSKITKQVTA